MLHESRDATHIVLGMDGTSSNTTASEGQEGGWSEGEAGLLASAWGRRPNLCPSIFLLRLEESQGREVSRGQSGADTAHFPLPATHTRRSPT